MLSKKVFENNQFFAKKTTQQSALKKKT